MSNAITEIDNTDLVFIFGYNPADSHPIVANHVINAKRNGAKIIVCDPRKIETARIADMHIALKNGSNIALLNAIGHVIIEEDLYDKSFVASRSEGFEEYRKIVEGYTPESVEEITGVSAQEIRLRPDVCQRQIRRHPVGMGVTQFYQGVETVRSLTSSRSSPATSASRTSASTRYAARTTFRAPAIWVRYRIPIRAISTSSSRRTAKNSPKPGRGKPACAYRLSHQRIAGTARRTVKCGRRTLWVRIRRRPTPNSRRSAKRSTIWNWLSSRTFS